MMFSSAFILWFGWYGFNCGSALKITGPDQHKIISIAAVNTTLAAASACFSALLTHWFISERQTGEGEVSLLSAMNGCLAGLVAVTAGCAVVETWASIIIGIIAGVLYLLSSKALVRVRIDDAVDAVPVHMSNGAWGGIAVGLFASPSRLERVYGHAKHVGLFYSWHQGISDGTLLGVQLCGILFVMGWVTCLMFPFFCILNYLGWFRADVLNEIAGLDLSYHGAKYADPEAIDNMDSLYQAQMRAHRSTANSRNRFTSSSGMDTSSSSV